MNNNISFELYDFDNKITKKRYDPIHKILVENEDVITGRDNSSIEMYNKWAEMITNTPNYNILVCLIDDEVVGFIAFMYLDIGLMLSEIQIKKEYQGKYKILKNMLREVLEISIKDKFKYKDVLGTISDKNIKSQEVFTHIGFKRKEGILYKISYKNLMKWIEK